MKTKNSTTIFILLLFPFSFFGQNELSQEQVLEDYIIFKEILINGHPSLYEYTSKIEWDSIFSSFEQKNIKEIRTSNVLFKSISSIADNMLRMDI